MYFVYALFSEKFDKIYIGFTSDIEKRLQSHNQLATKGFTVKFRPWKLVMQEVYSSKTEATKREKQLKSAQGRAFVRSLIKNQNL